MKKFLLCLILTTSLFAKKEKVKNDTCETWMHSRFGIAHREHKGVGFDKGYTTGLGFFTPRWQKDYQPFLDLRAHVFNNGYFASNIGAGSRFMNHDDTIIYGVNAYFDHRGWKHLEANQFGAGFELFSRYVDFRLNGYWPFGKSYHTEQFSFYKFRGNNALLQRDIRYAFPAADIDIGGTIPLFGMYSQLDLGVGSYYLFRQNATQGAHAGNAWGGKIRGEFDYSKWLVIGAEWTYDRIFHGRFNGFVRLTTPFGWKKRKQRLKLPKTYKNCREFRPMIRKRLSDVKRMEIIPMLEKKQITLSNNIPNFIFVNNEGQGVGAGVLPNPVGAGTFENPYNMLSLAETNSTEGDVIYLMFGDGTTANNDEGFTMKANQMLLGSGRAHTVDGVTFPAQTPGQTPAMTNSAGAGITLANATVVDGIDVNEPVGAAAILGSGINSATVTNCEITAAGGQNGIQISGLTEALTVTDNRITSSASTGNGILLTSLANTDEVDISSNTFSEGFQDTMDIQWDNTITAGQTTISGNTIDADGQTRGIGIDQLPNTLTLIMNNNDITTPTTGDEKGIEILSTTAISSLTLTMNNNTVTSGNNGIFANPSMQTCNITIDSNTVVATTQCIGISNGINSNPVDATISFTDNICTSGSTCTSIGFNGTSGTATSTISGNTLTSTGGSSLVTGGSNAYNSTYVITDNVLNGGGGNSIYDNPDNNTQNCLTITGNSGTGFINFEPYTGAEVRVKITDGLPLTEAGIGLANNGMSSNAETHPNVTISHVSDSCFPIP